MSLSSLIVQREVATIRQVEEALSRQVLYGGDLVTNVLEVAQVSEVHLMPLVAESTHMPHAPIGALPPPRPAALALVPVDLAVRRLLYPLDLVGDTLVVAVAQPLDSDVATELAFALGVLIEQRIAPLVRVREGHATAYGAPLDRRMQRLVSRLAGVETGASGSLPPLLAKAPSNSLEKLSSGPPAPEPAEEVPGRPAGAPPPHATNSGFPAVRRAADEPPDTDKTQPAPQVAPTSSDTAVTLPRIIAQRIVQVGDSTPRAEPRPPPPAPPPPSAAPEAPAERRSSAPPSRPSVLVRLVHHEATAPAARRRRGPLTLERAKLELDQASERDALLDLFFAFSLQFFEYSAIFIVHGDIAEGRDAYGPGVTRERVVGIGVTLELPSAISEARDRAAPVIARPAKDGLDAVLAQDLGRSAEWPILVVPIVVRGRTVAVLYGDNGPAGVDGTGSGEVTAFAARVGQAFERIIVRRKLGGFAADAPSAKPRIDPHRVATTLPRKDATTAPTTVLRKVVPSEGVVRPPTFPPPAPLPGVLIGPAPPRPSTTSPAFVAPAPPALDLTLTPAPSPGMVTPEAPARDARPGLATAPDRGAPFRAADAGIDTMPPEAPTTPGLLTVPSPPPDPPAEEATEIDEVEEIEEVEATAESDREPDTDEPRARVERDSSDNIVLPLSNRRTIRVAPLFPDESDVAPRPSQEFGDMPPPPQAAAVRRISEPPIPREDPEPPVIVSTTAAPRVLTEPSDWDSPTVEIEPEEDAAAAAETARLMEDLEKTNPEPRSAFFPHEAIRGGVEVSSIVIPKPPPSQAVAVAPHRPPLARTRPDALPSVIIDVSVEFLALVDRLARDPDDDQAESELLRQGQHAMPSIMARFPGPIRMTPAEIEEKRARVGDTGPILKLIAGQRRVALPFVLTRIDDPNPEARFWATFLLTELAYPEAVPGVVSRLFDEDPQVRRVARLAARAVAETARDGLAQELDRVARDPSASTDKRVKTMDALGEMRDPVVVPALIGAMSDDHEEVAVAARRALMLVSRQDFGRDPRRWLAWWSANSSRHRIEWLIDALNHDHAVMRKAAAQELKTVTREYFGYYDDLPKRERERAQQRYRDWWQSEGRARFRRA